MRSFSPEMRMQLQTLVIFTLLNTLKLLMNLSLKKTDLTRFFIIKARHPGRVK